MNAELSADELKLLDDALHQLTKDGSPERVMDYLQSSMLIQMQGEAPTNFEDIFKRLATTFQQRHRARELDAMRLRLKLAEIASRAAEFTPVETPKTNP